MTWAGSPALRADTWWATSSRIGRAPKASAGGSMAGTPARCRGARRFHHDGGHRADLDRVGGARSVRMQRPDAPHPGEDRLLRAGLVLAGDDDRHFAFAQDLVHDLAVGAFEHAGVEGETRWRPAPSPAWPRAASAAQPAPPSCRATRRVPAGAASGTCSSPAASRGRTAAPRPRPGCRGRSRRPGWGSPCCVMAAPAGPRRGRSRGPLLPRSRAASASRAARRPSG